MSTLAELIAQRDALQNQIDEARNEGVRAAFASIREILDANQITPGQLVAHFSGGKAKKANGNGSERAPVAAKYRDPATGDSWSGRGLQPRWLKAHVEAGRSVQEFAVQ